MIKKPVNSRGIKKYFSVREDLLDEDDPILAGKIAKARKDFAARKGIAFRTRRTEESSTR